MYNIFIETYPNGLFFRYQRSAPSTDFTVLGFNRQRLLPTHGQIPGFRQSVAEQVLYHVVLRYAHRFDYFRCQEVAIFLYYVF